MAERYIIFLLLARGGAASWSSSGRPHDTEEQAREHLAFVRGHWTEDDPPLLGHRILHRADEVIEEVTEEG